MIVYQVSWALPVGGRITVEVTAPELPREKAAFVVEEAIRRTERFREATQRELLWIAG